MASNNQSTGRQQKILIIEDEIDQAEMLNTYFGAQGYVVLSSSQGKKALALAFDELPDLVILDIHLPDIDGFEVAYRLRESHKTRHIPVLFLTERSERSDKLHGLEMGVVDYITKPFDIQELRLRVRNILQRVASTALENPVTGLPEGATVREALRQLVEGERTGWGLLVATLNGLDTFRELYGFVAGDDVLRAVSLMLNNAADEVGGQDVFCGHLTPQAFVMVTDTGKLDPLQARITERTDQSLEYFYPAGNRGPKAHTEDRLRLSMSRLTADQGTFASADDLKQALVSKISANE